MLRRVIAVGILAVAAAVGVGCTTATPNFCCFDIADCQRRGATEIVTCDDPARPYCDLAGDFGPSNLCISDPVSTACARPEDCTNPARPVCDIGGTDMCVRCEVPADCARFSDTPTCEPVSGGCVECLTSAECTSNDEPVCGSDFACRPCALDTECDSGVCNRATGACVPESQIVYVAPTGSGTACVSAAPCATIGDGVTAASGTRPFILVATGSYSERVTVTGKAFTLIGTGADLSPSTFGPVVEIQGASNVTIEGLRISGGGGASGDGVRCSDASGGTSTIVLRRVRIEQNSGRGITATNCMSTVDAARIIGNVSGGVVVSGGGVSIRNSFIAKNGAAAATVGGVHLLTPTSLTFEFNTIADNVATSGFAAGVQCSSGAIRTVPNNIIMGQAADQVSSTNCDFSYTISNEVIPGTTNSTTAPTFVDATANDYHLQTGSSGIDGADPAATVLTDIDGQSRPQGLRADVGADEAQ